MADNGMVLKLARNELVTIDCRKGRLWVTDGSPHDHLIAEGESLSLRPRGKLIVQALGGEALAKIAKG